MNSYSIDDRLADLSRAEIENSIQRYMSLLLKIDQDRARLAARLAAYELVRRSVTDRAIKRRTGPRSLLRARGLRQRFAIRT
jgi:hypothetical protein